MAIFKELEQTFFKFIWKHERSQIAKAIFFFSPTWSLDFIKNLHHPELAKAILRKKNGSGGNQAP